ncbi:coiled-coil domain-containing protein 113-like [Coccinella septempunctata]|uniref:coiled-coil domain-containing protein 113-like n=1 Tax=Coccinella septempunctata TaxID=41139 RepID=UPI001D06859C|nr:coiled-coil domain-containing protein 113-like [Coccinella septempunctata]
MTESKPEESLLAESSEDAEDTKKEQLPPDTARLSAVTETMEKKESTLLGNQPSIASASSTSSSSTESAEEDQDSQKVEETTVKKNPLDDLTYDELSKTVYELQTEYRHLTTENDMLERYLNFNDPQLLEGMAQMIENAIKMQGTESVRRATLADTYSVKSYTSATKIESSIVGTSSIIDRGPRINLTQKSDMIMKEMEEVQKNLNKFYKDSHRRKCALKAELEEVGIEIAETLEALNQFEQTVVIEGVDPLTQRIPAEKFVRYVQEWLKTSLAVIQKYRLRQSTLTSHLRKLKEVLKQKKELGESLHAVDFEKLQIENNHFLKEIDLRTLQLIDLKRMNGGANLILTNQKKFLMKQISEMQKIQRDIDETRNKIDDLERETEKAEEQLDRVKAHYESIRQMIEEYKVPDVMEYVRIKGKVYELQKNIKIWSRRSHLQDVALNSSIREMKNITGSKKVLDHWFEISHPQTTTSDLELKIRQKNSDEEDSMSIDLPIDLD